MLLIFIKAYGDNVAVNIKPIYSEKPIYTSSRVYLYTYKGKLLSLIAKKMFIESEIQKGLS